MTTTNNLIISVIKQCRLIAYLSLALIALSVHAQETGTDTDNDLFNQLLSLQSQMNIKIMGLDRIQNEAKINTRGNLEQQIEQLLASFNHIVSRDAKGRIERIVIVNKKQKTEDRHIVLPTSHQGNHFIVSVDISGNGSHWETMDMVIDTGADVVVLPESMIARLDLTHSAFTTRKMQTANGTAEAKVGFLSAVKIAGETLDHVQVAFIADALLGTNKLLGMSALGRYQINIDDSTQLVTLVKR